MSGYRETIRSKVGWWFVRGRLTRYEETFASDTPEMKIGVAWTGSRQIGYHVASHVLYCSLMVAMK